MKTKHHSTFDIIPSRLALIATGLLLAFTGHAAVVGYVGADTSTGGAWRTPSVLKSLDADGNNIYGSDGYVLSTSPGGDVSSPPAYATVARLADSTFTNGHITNIKYQMVDNPNPSGEALYTGLWYSTGTQDLEEQDLAEITVTAASSFRIGVLVDQTDVPDISPKHLRLRQVQGGAADSGQIDCYLEPNLDADWYFFDVVGAQARDKFVLSGTNMRAGSDAQDSNGIGAITFDPISSGAALELQLSAGLRITGSVGTVYSIEYITDLAQSNSPSAWRCLEYLHLPASPYLWFDKSGPVTGRRFYRAVRFPARANMVFIPPGTFRMGSPSNEVDRYDWEGPQTAVTISRGFWMGKCEVTQGEYLEVMGGNPSYFTGDSNRPVERVNWFDATNYCAALTQRERAAGRIATNSVYRLPTEAEWEYACRGRWFVETRSPDS